MRARRVVAIGPETMAGSASDSAAGRAVGDAGETARPRRRGVSSTEVSPARGRATARRVPSVIDAPAPPAGLDSGWRREVVSVQAPGVLENGRPDPLWVRGACPLCGDDLVSVLYQMGKQGYLLRWECWSSQEANPNAGGETAGCDYVRVL